MKNFYTVLFIVFIAIVAFCYALHFSESFNLTHLLIGNNIFFILTLISYAISYKATQSTNNSAFVRGALGGTFFKFLVAIAVSAIYLMLFKKEIRVSNIMVFMGIYIVYTVVETVFLSQAARQR